VTRGRFIVVEGAEGVGKTTQTKRLANFLRDRGLPLVVTREPGGTEIGEEIRNVVLQGRREPVSPETELLLILAARAALVREVVEPALARGEWVLSDRFALSSLAYQGYGRGIALDGVRRMNNFATGGLSPDLYVVICLDAERTRARQLRAGKVPDRFEAENPAFQAAVRRGYLELAETVQRAVIVGGEGSPDEVEARIRREVVSVLSATSEPIRTSGV